MHGAKNGITGFDRYFFKPSGAPKQLSISFRNKGNTLRASLNEAFIKQLEERQTTETYKKFDPTSGRVVNATRDVSFVDPASFEIMTHPVTLLVKLADGSIVSDATVDYSTYLDIKNRGTGKGIFTRTEIVGYEENHELQNKLDAFLNPSATLSLLPASTTTATMNHQLKQEQPSSSASSSVSVRQSDRDIVVPLLQEQPDSSIVRVSIFSGENQIIETKGSTSNAGFQLR